jgi:hypothetical protein
MGAQEAIEGGERAMEAALGSLEVLGILTTASR